MSVIVSILSEYVTLHGTAEGIIERFILDHSAMKARPNATAQQMKNIKRWLDNAHNPIEADEIKYLGKIDDLIPLVSKERAPLERLLDRFDLFYYMSWLVDKKVGRMMTSKPKDINWLEQKNARLYNDADFERETAVYDNNSLINKIATCLTLILGLSLLLGPLWWLQYLAIHQTDPWPRLQVVSGFLLLFTTILSIASTVKPLQVIAATAAYEAVLVLFLSLGSGTGG